MTESDEQVIARVAELDAKATKGWRFGFDSCGPIKDERGNAVCHNAMFGPQVRRNFDFIAESRTLLPDLASRLSTANQQSRAKDEEIARLRKALEVAEVALETPEFHYNPNGADELSCCGCGAKAKIKGNWPHKCEVEEMIHLGACALLEVRAALAESQPKLLG